MSHLPSPPFPNSLSACLASANFVEALRNRLGRYDRNADDVLGETLVRLCQPNIAGRFRPELGTPLQFSLGIACKVMLEFRRRHRREVHFYDEAVNNIPASGQDLVKHAMHQEWHVAVEKALWMLPFQDRQLVLRRFESKGQCKYPLMSNRERIRLCRALKQLRQMLRQFE